MSNGSDDQDDNGARRGRRRQAVRPPIIEGEAREVTEPEATDGQAEAAGETAAEAPRAEPADFSATESETPDTAVEGAGTDEPETAHEEPQAGETEELETVEPAPAPAGERLPTARRASVIAAGLLGALIAVGIYFGLDQAGLLPKAGATNAELTESIRDLNRRVAGIESTMARAAKRDTSKAVGDKVSELERAVKELGSDPRNSLIRRMADAETKLDSIAQSVTESPLFKDFDSRIAYVEDKLAEAGSGAVAAAGGLAGDIESRFAAIEDRLGGVEARPAVVSPDGQPVDDAAVKTLSERIAALDQQMRQTADTVATLSKDAAAASADRLKEIDAALAAMRAELDKLGGAVDGITSDVGAKLADLEKTVAEGGSQDARRMARSTAGALAVTSLERTVDAGNPYTTELDVLRPLVQDQADLAVLEAHAETGVPDLATLQTRFAATANDILTAGAPGAEGIVASLMDSARSLVRIRPTGMVEGSGRGAVVARIEAALAAGDLKSAAGEWDGLDEAAKAASKTWADDLKARIAVNGALADLSSALAASLAGATAND